MSILSVHDPMTVRRRGAVRLFVWLGVFAVMATVPLFLLPRFGFQLTPLGMIPFALPGAYALVGLMEMVTGVPFSEFARRWDELKGWQRGVFGTFIVVAAGVLILVGIVLVLQFS